MRTIAQVHASDRTIRNVRRHIYTGAAIIEGEARKTTKAATPYEEQDHMALAELLDLIKYNGRPLRWFHVPNGGSRNAIEAAKLKKMGVKAGLPDIFILDPPPKCPEFKGAVIELKRKDAGRVSPAQLDWNIYLLHSGWLIKIANGLDAAIQQLKDWGYMKSR
jgi:hypothetical protein